MPFGKSAAVGIARRSPREQAKPYRVSTLIGDLRLEDQGDPLVVWRYGTWSHHGLEKRGGGIKNSRPGGSGFCWPVEGAYLTTTLLKYDTRMSSDANK